MPAISPLPSPSASLLIFLTYLRLGLGSEDAGASSIGGCSVVGVEAGVFGLKLSFTLPVRSGGAGLSGAGGGDAAPAADLKLILTISLAVGGVGDISKNGELEFKSNKVVQVFYGAELPVDRYGHVALTTTTLNRMNGQCLDPSQFRYILLNFP